MPDDVRGHQADPNNPASKADPPAGGGGGPPASSMVALGELICRINPYTDLPKDQTSGLSTGKMEVAMLPPAQQGYTPGNATIACMGIEVERGYKPTWTFKGQEQSVTAAAKVPYRFPVYKNGELAYWQTEFLLIGFVGGGGMG